MEDAWIEGEFEGGVGGGGGLSSKVQVIRESICWYDYLGKHLS